MFIFVHIPHIFSVLLTYSLKKINSLLFDPRCIRDRLWLSCAVLHAVNMAVLNRNTSSLKGCTLYVSLYPDNDCAKSIIQSKLKEIVYWHEKREPDDQTKAAKLMMTWSKIKERLVFHQPINYY